MMQSNDKLTFDEYCKHLIQDYIQGKRACDDVLEAILLGKKFKETADGFVITFENTGLVFPLVKCLEELESTIETASPEIWLKLLGVIISRMKENILNNDNTHSAIRKRLFLCFMQCCQKLFVENKLVSDVHKTLFNYWKYNKESLFNLENFAKEQLDKIFYEVVNEILRKKEGNNLYIDIIETLLERKILNKIDIGTKVLIYQIRFVLFDFDYVKAKFPRLPLSEKLLLLSIRPDSDQPHLSQDDFSALWNDLTDDAKNKIIDALKNTLGYSFANLQELYDKFSTLDYSQLIDLGLAVDLPAVSNHQEAVMQDESKKNETKKRKNSQDDRNFNAKKTKHDDSNVGSNVNTSISILTIEQTSTTKEANSTVDSTVLAIAPIITQSVPQQVDNLSHVDPAAPPSSSTLSVNFGSTSKIPGINDQSNDASSVRSFDESIVKYEGISLVGIDCAQKIIVLKLALKKSDTMFINRFWDMWRKEFLTYPVSAAKHFLANESSMIVTEDYFDEFLELFLLACHDKKYHHIVDRIYIKIIKEIIISLMIEAANKKRNSPLIYQLIEDVFLNFLGNTKYDKCEELWKYIRLCVLNFDFSDENNLNIFLLLASKIIYYNKTYLSEMFSHQSLYDSRFVSKLIDQVYRLTREGYLKIPDDSLYVALKTKLNDTERVLSNSSENDDSLLANNGVTSEERFTASHSSEQSFSSTAVVMNQLLVQAPQSAYPSEQDVFYQQPDNLFPFFMQPNPPNRVAEKPNQFVGNMNFPVKVGISSNQLVQFTNSELLTNNTPPLLNEPQQQTAKTLTISNYEQEVKKIETDVQNKLNASTDFQEWDDNWSGVKDSHIKTLPNLPERIKNSSLLELIGDDSNFTENSINQTACVLICYDFFKRFENNPARVLLHMTEEQMKVAILEYKTPLKETNGYKLALELVEQQSNSQVTTTTTTSVPPSVVQPRKLLVNNGNQSVGDSDEDSDMDEVNVTSGNGQPNVISAQSNNSVSSTSTNNISSAGHASFMSVGSTRKAAQTANAKISQQALSDQSSSEYEGESHSEEGEVTAVNRRSVTALQLQPTNSNILTNPTSSLPNESQQKTTQTYSSSIPASVPTANQRIMQIVREVKERLKESTKLKYLDGRKGGVPNLEKEMDRFPQELFDTTLLDIHKKATSLIDLSSGMAKNLLKKILSVERKDVTSISYYMWFYKFFDFFENHPLRVLAHLTEDELKEAIPDCQIKLKHLNNPIIDAHIKKHLWILDVEWQDPEQMVAVAVSSETTTTTTTSHPSTARRFTPGNSS